MKKFFARFLSMALALVALFGLISPAQMVSAASTTASIKDSTFIFRNEKTDKCINNYGGNTANGTKTTLWSYSKGDTDLWVRCLYRNGGYKIFDHELKTVIVDVYRGSKSKAAVKMKIDCWADQKSEDAFQIWIFERQSNGSYILRLKSQREGLALGITKNANGAQLQLVSYNKNDASQRWFICGTDGKKLSKSQIEGTSYATTPSKDLKNIPSANYKVTATFTISSTKYQFCSVTKAWGSAAKGTEFYLKASNKSLVTDKATLEKLATIQVVNAVRSTYTSALDSMKTATNSVYSVACQWTRNTQVSKFIGVSSGSALRAIASATTGQPIGVFNSVITLCTEALEPETALAATTILCLKATSNDAIYWCNRAKALLSTPISDFSCAVNAARAISEAYGNYEAAMFLGRPIVEDAAKANAWTSTFQNIGLSILEGCGFKTADALSKFENIVYLGDALSQYKVTEKYNAARNRVLNALILG